MWRLLIIFWHMIKWWNCLEILLLALFTSTLCTELGHTRCTFQSLKIFTVWNKDNLHGDARADKHYVLYLLCSCVINKQTFIINMNLKLGSASASYIFTDTC